MKIIGNSSVRRLILAAVLSIGLGFGTHVSAALGYPSYLIDLNTRTAIGLGNLSAIALNDAGQAAGISRTAAGWDSPLRAVITGPNGVGMTDLGTLGSIFNSATGINAAGQVVGYSGPSYSGRAFITGPNGVGMTGLGTLGGDWSRAYGINAAGQVVGASQTSTGLSRAFITGPNGVGMIDLGTLGGRESWAHAINAAGRVVGESYTSTDLNSPLHAFITGPNGVGMTDLGTLGGNYSWATDVNAIGQVVGYSGSSYLSSSAFITDPNGVGMTGLGALGGSAFAINDAGQVVGNYYTATGQSHAFITGPNGVGMTDLNSLVDLSDGVVLSRAVAINNTGQVIATTVPEPESYALMLAGVALMGVMVRRKQKGCGYAVRLGNCPFKHVISIHCSQMLAMPELLWRRNEVLLGRGIFNSCRCFGAIFRPAIIFQQTRKFHGLFRSESK